MSGRSLPARPSVESLRKQAKALARAAARGNADAIARVHAQSPAIAIPLSTRDAQFVIAREYGFPGWTDLLAEVHTRVGGGLDWAAGQAMAAIHDDDNDRLRKLLTEFPALVTWRGDSGTLMAATTSYALDCSDPERERIYNRPAAAEILIDAGAQVDQSTWEHVIATGAAGMLHLLARKKALPSTLPVLAALGDDAAVRARLDESGAPDAEGFDPQVVGRALMNACRFGHARIASRLLDRTIEIDPPLGDRIDRWQDHQGFIGFLIAHPRSHWSGGPVETPGTSPWEAFVIRQLTSALDAGDLIAFNRWLHDESWLLRHPFVHVQIAIIERSSWQDQERCISALLEHEPSLLHTKPAPASQALVFALEYGHAHLIPMLTRIWPLPDDLPHAAGTGDAAAVARWFDSTGRARLGSLRHHFSPAHDAQRRADLHWGPVSTQQVLDVALAWACVNRHFDIAAFLLERGADINTTWSTHEPASILHECAIHGNEEAVRFLIAHGADLSIEDYRYHATAEGWARYAAHDDRMADLLAAAAQTRDTP